MKLSKFGEKFTRKAGITQLMDDLGAAMAQGGMLMLGGGNPAHIPEVQDIFRNRMEEILAEPKGFESMIGNYDGSRGNAAFIDALAEMLRETFGWNIDPENIALIIPGHHFFPGLEKDGWPHKHECIRVTYAQDEAVVREGIRVVADEVKKLYG